MRDVPDELKKNEFGYFTGVKTGVFHLDDYWNFENLTKLQKQEFNYKAVGTSLNKYDADLDLYQFNFMGVSGRFVIVKENGAFVPKLVSKGKAIKIEPTMDTASKAISAFKITDTKGYVYLFNKVEQTTSVTSFGSRAQGYASTDDINEQNLPEIITINSSWHLTSIQTSNGISLVDFSYAPDVESYVVSMTRTINKVVAILGSANFTMEDLNKECNSGKMLPYKTVSWLNNTSTTQKLSQITFNDGTSVELTPETGHPETSGSKLKAIRIKDERDAVNKTYTLAYETTTDNTTIVPTQRLWLTKITETAGTINHDYVLTYNNKQDLPGFDSSKQDDWGYYSGIGYSSVNCDGTFPVTYSDDIIKTGLLQSISYPSGGVKEFDFEHHTYSYEGNQTIGFDDYIINPRNSSIQSQFTDSFVYNHTGISAPVVPIDTFTIGFTQDIYISSWVNANPAQYLKDHRITIYESNPQQGIVYLELDLQCQVIKNVPPGTYTMALAPWENLNSTSYQIAGDFRVTYRSQASQLKEEMIGGGVRIKSISFKDTPQSIAKTVNYAYGHDENPVKSSGVIDAELDRLTRNYTFSQNYVNLNFGLNDGPVTYDVMVRGNRAQLSQGEYVGYRSVKVSETGNGYILYNHTSAYEYPSPANVFDLPNPTPAPNIDYKRGLLTKKRTYNENGNILQEVSHFDDNNILQYGFVEEALFTARIPFKDPNCPWFVFYDHWTAYNAGSVLIGITSCDPSPSFTWLYDTCPSYDLRQNTTVFNSGWAKLNGATTKEYFYDAQGTQSVKEVRQVNTYNSDNYQIAVQDTYYSVNGTEELLTTKYFYPVGLNLGSNTQTNIDKLVAANKVTEVLETQTFKNPTPPLRATQIKLSETHNVYDDFSVASDPLMLPMAVEVGIGSNTPEPRIEFLDYDAYGNPTEVKKADGTSIIYAYGFNGTVPVAKITNGDYTAVKSLLGGSLNVAQNLTASQEASLRSSSPDAMVSFYRYDPLKGLTSAVDDRGYLTTYEYDAFNRLIRIKDAQGNILSENTYHYKNP